LGGAVEESLYAELLGAVDVFLAIVKEEGGVRGRACLAQGFFVDSSTWFHRLNLVGGDLACEQGEFRDEFLAGLVVQGIGVAQEPHGEPPLESLEEGRHGGTRGKEVTPALDKLLVGDLLLECLEYTLVKLRGGNLSAVEVAKEARVKDPLA